MRVSSATFVAAAASPERLPPEAHPEIAFAGRSNVGKSSLLNRLVGRRNLARVSKTPGRTQQINFFTVNDAITFADLPGYGFARVPLPVKARWKALVEHYLRSRRCLRAVVAIVDARRGVEPDDEQLLSFLAALRVPAVLVATKLDKLKRSERARALGRLYRTERPVIAVSAESGEGIRELWETIERLAR